MKYTSDQLEPVKTYLQTGQWPPAADVWSIQHRQRFRQRWAGARVDNGGVIWINNRLQLVPQDRVDDILNQIYNDAALTGNRDVLYERLTSQYLGISRRRVSQFLKTQQTWQVLQRKRIHPKTVQPLLALKPGLWAMDLINMQAYRNDNDQVGYILVVIDHFTKRCFLRAIPRKFARETVRALTDIFRIAPRLPARMLSDSGTEFRAQVVQTFLATHKIKPMYSPVYRPTSNSVAERLVGKTKSRLFAVLEQRRSRRWLNLLASIELNLNTSRHSSTGFAPLVLEQAVEDRNEEILAKARAQLKRLAEQRLQNAQRKAAHTLPPIEVGDVVRVSFETMKEKRKQKGRKSYLGQYSKSLHQVVRISPGSSVNMSHFRLRVYPDGAEVSQRYYRRDLLKIDIDRLQLPPVQPVVYIPPPSLLLERRTEPRQRRIRPAARLIAQN